MYSKVSSETALKYPFFSKRNYLLKCVEYYLCSLWRNTFCSKRTISCSKRTLFCSNEHFLFQKNHLISPKSRGGVARRILFWGRGHSQMLFGSARNQHIGTQLVYQGPLGCCSKFMENVKIFYIFKGNALILNNCWPHKLPA